MDPDGFSLAAPAVAEDSGLLESQRSNLERWRKEESIFRDATVVSGVAVSGEVKWNR
jgi:hypothetical protein